MVDKAPVPAPAPPTLDDVAALTPESDFSAFTAPAVAAEVRNAALRKLFHSDPHFGVPDGLDVNAEEAAASEHSPLERQRQILRARAFGLLDDDLSDQGDAPAEPPTPAADAAPQPGPHGGGYCGPT